MRRVVVGVMLAAGLALVACSGDDEEEPAAPSADEATATPPTALGAPSGPTSTPAVTAGAGPAANTTATPGAPSTAAASGSAPAAPSASGDNECSVTITGAVTAAWTSDRTGPGAIVVGDWIPDPAPEDAGYFGLNCFDADFNIVGFTSAFGSAISAQPATYQITGDDGAPIEADVTVATDDGVWEPTGGVLEIVEFDDAHIRGTFSFDIEDSFDPSRTAHVEGSFAYTR